MTIIDILKLILLSFFFFHVCAQNIQHFFIGTKQLQIT